MLDGTPVARSKPHLPRFHEHISELADTSSPPPTLTPGAARKRWGSVLYADGNPPNLGSPEANNASSRHDGMMDDARRRQQQLHLMSWNNYEEGRAAELQGSSGTGVAATIGWEKARPTERGLERKEGEVSPDETNSPLDPRFIISPLGSLERSKR
jgi:hypothetical protein